MADAILLLAGLDFLGLGIRLRPELGRDALHGLQYIYDGYWWLIVPAGASIVLSVTASTSSATACATLPRRGGAKEVGNRGVG